MGTTAFTICSANYLHYARSLHQSLVASAGLEDFVCFLVDEVDGRFDRAALGFECVEVKDIGLAHVFDMAARYSIMEMNTAVKPFCFRWLFDVRQTDRAIYLDPDLFLVSPLTEIDAAFDAGANVVLTPHSMAPLNDGKDPDDIRLMQTGTYNLGFGALRNTLVTRSLLDWWGERLLTECLVDLEHGLFVDQKFFDLVPAYFEGVEILRHPGYNVAYWNLASRNVQRSPSGRWTVNGSPLRFFHFSGVVPGNSRVFSKHQDRFTVHDIGDVIHLLDEYLTALESNTKLNGIALPSLGYAYGTLADGTPFTDHMRRVYRETFASRPRSYAEAFDPSLGRYCTIEPRFAHLREERITRLMYAVWDSRADLRENFPIALPSGRQSLASWFFDTAEREARIPAALVEQTRNLFDSSPLPVPSLVRAEQSSRDAIAQGDDPPAWLMARRLPDAGSLDIGMVGYFGAETGLGAAARQNYRALKSVGVDVTAYCMPSPGFAANVIPEFDLRENGPDHDTLVLHVNADSVGLVESYFDPALLRRKHKIGYWAWELARMPLEWIGAYERIDEIWAPSKFSAQAFAERTDKPVSVMAHPVDVPPEPADIAALRAALGIPLGRFIFLTAFDLNSYIDRKNPEGAVDSFSRAFEPTSSSPVLVVKLHGKAHRSSRYVSLMEKIARNPNIIVLDRVLDAGDISALQWCCDAFVSLHRSEGFGLWIAECMARGKPCIVTDYSGNTDFTNHDNTLPIGFEMVNIEAGQYPFGLGQSWAEPAVDEAVDAMRSLVGDEALRRRIGTSAREHIATALAPRRIGRVMKRRLHAGWAEMLDILPVRL